MMIIMNSSTYSIYYIDFYIIIDDLTITGTSQTYLGTLQSGTSTSLIKINRLSVYENKPVKFSLFIWK